MVGNALLGYPDARSAFEDVQPRGTLGPAQGRRNPCRFVQKYKEKKRERFLTDEEFHRLGQVLKEIVADGSVTLSAATAIRLLMLTGCPLNEIQTLSWEDAGLDAAELQQRDSTTAARMVPLARIAVSVLFASRSPRRQSLGHRRQKPSAHLTDLQHP